MRKQRDREAGNPGADGRCRAGKEGADGNRGQVFAIGPSVKYETASRSHLIFQWQKESRAENRFQGDMFWFKLIMPIL